MFLPVLLLSFSSLLSVQAGGRGSSLRSGAASSGRPSRSRGCLSAWGSSEPSMVSQTPASQPSVASDIQISAHFYKKLGEEPASLVNYHRLHSDRTSFSSSGRKIKGMRQGHRMSVFQKPSGEVEVINHSKVSDPRRAGLIHLFDLEKTRDGFLLRLAPESDKGPSAQGIYRVLAPYEAHTLRVNDVLRLGQTELRVHQLHPRRGNILATAEGSMGVIAGKVHVDIPGREEDTCGICFDGPTAERGKEVLGFACECTERMYHPACMEQWRRSRAPTRRGSCEVCNSQYSFFFKRDDSADAQSKASLKEEDRAQGKRVDEWNPRYLPSSSSIRVGDPPVFQGPVVLFENLSDPAIRCQSRIVSGTMARGETALSLGGGGNIQVKGDKFLCHRHIEVQLSGEDFIIGDGNSKYGTLIRLFDDLPIHFPTPDPSLGRSAIQLQIGSLLVDIERK